MRELRSNRFLLIGLAMVVLAIVSFMALRHASAASAMSRYSATEMSSQSKELLALVNYERVQHKLPPLSIDPRLNESAQFKADDMAARDYFGHLDPVTDEKNGVNKAIDLEGSNCASISENLYWGRATNTPLGAITWWLQSPTHRAALLSPTATTTGFGIAGNKYVQHFCAES